MNEKPARDETNEYYFKYIDLVPEGDIASILDAQGGETLSLLQSIPESLGGHRYAEGKWSVAEVLGHINDAERLFMMRAFWFARGMSSELPSYESDDATVASGAAGRTVRSHADEFAALRGSTVSFFRELPGDAWMRRGVASDYPFSVRSLAYIAAGHVIHHTRILKERYLPPNR